MDYDIDDSGMISTGFIHQTTAGRIALRPHVDLKTCPKRKEGHPRRFHQNQKSEITINHISLTLQFVDNLFGICWKELSCAVHEAIP